MPTAEEQAKQAATGGPDLTAQPPRLEDEEQQDLAALEAELRAEVESMDPGELADTEEKRLLFKYVRARQRIAMEAQRVADQMKAMLRGFDSRLKGLDAFFGPPAARITRELLAGQGGKAKSIKTPFGTVGFRKQNAKLVVTDEAKLIDHCQVAEGMGDCIVPDWKLVKSEVNAHFERTGEIPPGVEIEPETEKFYCK